MMKAEEQEKKDPQDTSQPAQIPAGASRPKPVYLCDRCGFQMYEATCKVICPNCGGRYDCSDLSIYFD